ncbi:MAG: TonB-dependent receptor [Bacteroidota bacterium]
MKLKGTMLILALASYLSLSAQFSINGTVKNAENNEPLAGAHVLINNQLRTDVTNKNGQFVATSLPKGNYTIHVSFVGFESSEQTIELSSNQTIEIVLKRKSIIFEEVIVKATRANEKTPTAFENINKDEIQKLNDARNITAVIDQSLSMVTTSDAGNGIGNVGYRLRGTDETRINVTIDGVPLNDPESQGAWFVNLPDFASSVDNVQIQRGVGTSSNGAAAFGGSMNFQTLKFQPNPYAQINEIYGSYNTWKHNLNFGTGLINGHFAIDGRVSKITSDGFIDRATSDLSSIYLAGSYFGKKTMVKFLILSGKEKTYQSWDGVPSYILDTNRTYNGIGQYTDENGQTKYYNNETDNYTQSRYHLTFAHEFNSKLNITSALHYTRGFGYYEQYREDDSYSNYGVENQIIKDSTLYTSDLIRRKYLDNYFYGLTISANYQPIEKLSITLGGAINKYEGNHFGQVEWMQYAVKLANEFEYYRGTGDKRDANIYTKINYQLMKKLNLWVDCQYRNIDYKITGIDDKARAIDQHHNWNFFNPKGGISYEINEKNNVYASYSIANREPTRSNLVDAVDTMRPTPERLYDFELGYHFSHNKFSFNTNLYYMNYKDQLVFTGQINDVGDAIMKNMKKSYRAGIELSAIWQPLKFFKWQINTTLSRNKIKSYKEFVDDWDTGVQHDTLLGETNIAFSPEIIASSGITVNPYKNFEITLLSKYVGKQYIDNSSSKDRKLNGYLINNISFRYTLKSKNTSSISLFFSINNIFSEKYESNAWIYSYYVGGERKALDGYYPQAGRNFSGGISVKL